MDLLCQSLWSCKILTDEKAILLTGNLEPLTPTGSLYGIMPNGIRVITWRGCDEWQSMWLVENGNACFSSIKTPKGTIINWGSKRSLKKFIPKRHIEIVTMIADARKDISFNKELI